MSTTHKELPDRPPQPSGAYDPVRREEINRKHAAGPEPYLEWQDIAASAAGMPRYGEL